MNEVAGVEPTTRRLPLWKNALAALVERGLTYEDNVSVEWLEGELAAKRDTMAFELAVSEIRRALESRGLYLSGYGRAKTVAYTVLPANQNVNVLDHYARQMVDAARRAVTLGSATDRGQLTEAEGDLLDRKLRKMATRLALIQRQKSIDAIPAKNATQALK